MQGRSIYKGITTKLILLKQGALLLIAYLLLWIDSEKCMYGTLFLLMMIKFYGN